MRILFIIGYYGRRGLSIAWELQNKTEWGRAGQHGTAQSSTAQHFHSVFCIGRRAFLYTARIAWAGCSMELED